MLERVLPTVVVLAVAVFGGTAKAQSDGEQWSGFYAGIYGGFGEGTVTATNSNTSLDTEGRLGGTLMGYGWGAGPAILRIEADAGLSDVTNVVPFGQARIDAVGSITGRVGVPLGPLMPYVAAGGAVATASLDDGNTTASALHLGYLVSAGIEAAVGEAFALRGEAGFLHLLETDYPDAPGGPASITYDTTFVRGGLLARF